MKEPEDLDPLLDGIAPEAPDVPRDLAERVLHGLQPELMELRLDRLLDLLEVTDVPADLGPRVALRLKASRKRSRSKRPARRLLLVAAILLAALAAVLRFARGAGDEAGDHPTIHVAEIDPELLESLDLLENWELVMDDELELLLAELDDVDASLFEAANDLDIPWDDVPWEEG